MDMRKEILAYALEKHGTLPECPWFGYPLNQVLRHQDNGKWYGLIMPVSRDRLGLSGDGDIEVINVKGDVLQVDTLKGLPGFYPAWHMNKTHWITIGLDGQVPLEDILYFLEISWELTRNRK